MRVARYILAGGMSSRMGQDKAMIELGGKTLLARAVEAVKSICTSESVECHGPVTVIGPRTLLEGADRVISDNYPGCGPLGGMEAALADLDCTRVAEWALFLPVDMPLLPHQLLIGLVHEWAAAAGRGALVCHVVVDDQPQPLVSLMHRALRSYLEDALKAENFRVTRVLQSACNTLASVSEEPLSCKPSGLRRTLFTSQFCSTDEGWLQTAAQRRSRHLWFANLNTKNDLEEAETFLSDPGWNETMVSEQESCRTLDASKLRA